MPNVTAPEHSPFVFKTSENPNVLNLEGQDVWFDAIDWVEMNETWFEASNELCSQPSFVEKNCESLVPFTEDCRRCIRQLIGILGDYKQSEILSVCLSKLLPGVPASIVLAANSLYTAIIEKKYIDIAVFHSLGLASWCLPDDINVISQIADFIRKTVSSWTDDTFVLPFLGEDEKTASGYLFTALAVAAIAARYWMTDRNAPQRGMLKVPAFIANLFIRVSHYWHALGYMAHQPQSVAENVHAHPPAFEVDTCIKTSRDLALSRDIITAFSSNSTACPEVFTRATVENRPLIVVHENKALADKAHSLVLQRLKQDSGISMLLYCKNHKLETQRTTNETEITHTWINTRCDAIGNPQPLSESHIKDNIPESQISAASNHAGDTLLPLVATAAVVPLVTSYMQPLKSKTVFAAGSIAAAGGLALSGKLLWDSIRSDLPDKSVKEKIIRRKEDTPMAGRRNFTTVYDLDINDIEFSHRLYDLIAGEEIKSKVQDLTDQYKYSHMEYSNEEMIVAMIFPLVNFMENSGLNKNEVDSGMYILSFFLNKVAPLISEENSKDISRRMKSIFDAMLDDERIDAIFSVRYNQGFAFVTAVLETIETATVRDKLIALRDIFFKNKDRIGSSDDKNKKLAINILRRFVKYMLAKAHAFNIQEKYESEHVYYSFLRFISSPNKPVSYYRKINEIQSLYQLYKQDSIKVLRYENNNSKIMKMDFFYSDFLNKIYFFITGLKNENFNVYEIFDRCINPLKSIEPEKEQSVALLSRFINLLYDCQRNFVVHHNYKEIRDVLRNIIVKSFQLSTGVLSVVDMSILFNKSLPALIDAIAHKAMNRIVGIYDPVINPVFFLNQQINKKIKLFEIERQLTTKLTPETKINVYFKSTIYTPATLGLPLEKTITQVKPYTLQEIVCGYHELELDRNNILKIEHSELIESLRKGDKLHDVLVNEFSSYINNDAKNKELKEYLNYSAIYRCAALLSVNYLPDSLKDAIKSFLLGKKTADTLSFHGQSINGAIVIHEMNSHLSPLVWSVLIDLDSPVFFMLATLNGNFVSNDPYSDFSERKLTVRHWPESKKFRQWVLHKIPSRYHHHYLKEKDAFSYDYYKTRAFSSSIHPEAYLHYSLPFFYNNEITLSTLPDVLFDDLKKRWEMDVQDLYITEDKLYDIEKLQLIRLITQIGSYAAPLLYAVPGTGTIIAAVVIEAINIGMASAHIASDISLAKIYPDGGVDKDYIEDAISTGVFMVLGEMLAAGSTLFSEVLLESRTNALSLASNIGREGKPQIRRIVSLSEKEKIAENAAGLTKDVIHDSAPAYNAEAETVNVLSPESSEMIKRIKKPKKEHFTVEGVFDEDAYNKVFEKYQSELKKRYLSQQTSRLSSDEFERRTIQANAKLSILRQEHPEILKELYTADLGAFSLTTIKNDPATALVLSSHGWFTKNSPNALIPRGKYITFLGPHGQTLREIESLDLLLPTETLLTHEFSVYSRLANKDSLISGELTENLGLAKNRLEASGTEKLSFVRNYSLKFYEKTPLEEVKVAVVANRIEAVAQKAKNIIKMDMLIPSSFAGGLTLKDVINEMKPGGRLARYQNLYYYACREEKVPFTLESVSSGLHSHDIKLNKIPSDPGIPLQMRKGFPALIETTYDGYFLYTLINITRDGDSFIVNESVIEMQPYKFEDEAIIGHS